MTRLRPGHFLRPLSLLTLLGGLLGGVVLPAAPALAQGDEMDPAGRVESLYAEARQAYEDLELDRAKNALRMALRLADTQGIERPSLLAKVHLMLGVVLHAESRQEQPTEDEFAAALSLDPGVRLDPTLASSTLEAIFQRARLRVSAAAAPPVLVPVPTPPLPLPGPGPGATPPGTPAASGPVVLNHRRVPRAYERVNIPIFVETQTGGAVQRIVLRYRRPGAAWNEVDLISQTGDGASGYIPGSAVVGDWIEYYIEATDWANRVVAEVGSAVAPVRVSVVQARLPGADDGGSWSGRREPEPSTRLVHLVFGAGTGAGIAKAPPLRRPDVLIDEGFAPTVFHLYNEVGFFFSSDFMVLLATRVQLILEKDRGIFEPLLSLRGRWFIDNQSPVRAFLGAGGGWCGVFDDCGYVQHSVNLQPVEDFTDTTREGNAHAGAEGGVIFDLSPHVGLELDLFTYALFGKKSSFQIDLNAGLVFSF